MHGLVAIFRKEQGDHFTSLRFLIIFILIFAAGIAAIYSAAQGIRGEITGTTQFVFIRLFTSSGGVLPPFITFVAFLMPLMGIVLGFDAINSEKASGTLSRILSQPLFRDSVINGKFMAGLSIITLMMVSITLLVAGLGLRIIGVPPSVEEVVRIGVFVILAIIYGAFWLALSTLFSILFRRTATSALVSLAIWIAFIFFMPIVAGAIANSVVPVAADSPVEVAIRNEELRGLIQRISPGILFEEATIALLIPTIRSLGPIMVKQTVYMLPTPLPLEQSLLLIWPQFISLFALTSLCFGFSYVKFMREEIRA